MGNTKIWYWPNTEGKAVEIDLGMRLSGRAGPYSAYMRDAAQSMAGDLSQITYLGWERIRIEHRWGGNTTAKRRVRNALEGLLAHLDNNGWCALAEDAQYAFAAFSSYNPAGSPVIIPTGTNVFRRLHGLVQPSMAGREVVYQGDPENYRKEHHICSSHVDGVSLSIVDGGFGALRLDYSAAAYTWVREIGSYPALRIPLEARGSEYLRHDRERVFYLDLPLETDITQLRAWRASDLPYPGTDGGGPLSSDLVNPDRPVKNGGIGPTQPWYTAPTGRRR